VLAIAPWGGFAEEAVADAESAAPLPPGVDPTVAACFPMAYGTSLHALEDRGGLRAGETLLVLGAGGGVGLAAVEVGKLLGARVLAAASAAKHQACREAGADEVIDYLSAGWRDEVKRLAGPRGLDVVYDAVGGAWAEPAMRLLGWGGRYLVVGFAGGEIPRPPLNLPLLKGFSLVGVYWGEFLKREPAAARAALGKLLGWLAAGRLRPRPPARYPLERAAEALRDLQARRLAGKAVLVVR
jgi:NADPH2:quinone reductase